MRPERLELAGFGAFPESTVVDFEGVDLFALVGPTGAGKSTILDAIAFALYGSVARYENPALVGPVVAARRAEARVRLDFSVAGTTGDAHIRAVVREPARPGLADEVRALFEHVVEVAVEAPEEPGAGRRRARAEGLTPVELVTAYCGAANLEVTVVVPLFAELHEEATG